MNRYGALQFIAGFYKLLGFLAPILFIILALLTAMSVRNPDVIAVLFLIIWGFVVGISLYGFGELISLFINVEENTRKTALYLERLAGRRKSE